MAGRLETAAVPCRTAIGIGTAGFVQWWGFKAPEFFVKTGMNRITPLGCLIRKGGTIEILDHTIEVCKSWLDSYTIFSNFFWGVPH